MRCFVIVSVSYDFKEDNYLINLGDDVFCVAYCDRGDEWYIKEGNQTMSLSNKDCEEIEEFILANMSGVYGYS